MRLASVAAVALLASACESTAVSGLRVRAEPSTQSAIIMTMASSGTVITIVCFARGEPVNGNPLWYRISSPRAGYVSGFYINTDNDTASSTPAC